MKLDRETYILINPASRSGYSLKIWQKELAPLFTKAGVTCHVMFSDENGKMAHLSEEITREKKPVNLIVLGGDGTAGDAINGIADLTLTDFGYIPTGSSNDFARAIHQTDPVAAAKTILAAKEEPRRVDLGELLFTDPDTGKTRQRLFLVSAGMGFDAAACEMADRSRWKKILNRVHLGKLIYLFSAIRLILTSRLEPLEVRIGSAPARELHFGHALFAACMNHPYEGGGFMFCPGAKDDDGILDLCVAADISKAKFFRMFPKAYTGGHVGKDGVTIDRGEVMSFRFASPQFFHTDGEVLGKGQQVQLRIRKKALRLLNLQCS